MDWQKKETKFPMSSGPITCYGRKACQFIIFMKLFKLCLKKKQLRKFVPIVAMDGSVSLNFKG